MVSLFYIFSILFTVINSNDKIRNKRESKWNNLRDKLENKIIIKNRIDSVKRGFWKNRFNKVIDEYMKLVWKNKYDKVIGHVDSNFNYYYWKKNNSLVDYLNKYKMIVVNLECFYNYTEKKLYHSYYLNNIIKFCNYNNKPIFLIGELHPNKILCNFFNIIESLSLPNYLSPFHYEKSKKLKNNRFSDKSDYLNVNKMIKDLLNENKVNKKNVCYLGNNLTNYNSFQLSFN
jgi:hypothetical protein